MKTDQGSYTNFNSKKWDQWVFDHCIWTIPISHDEFVRATLGNYSLYVTPQKVIPNEWLEGISTCRVLALASAGGQQCPILNAIGANVTVLDNSKNQLETEKSIADRESYSIDLIKGDMSQSFPFDRERFDVIINPVSNSYIRDLAIFWDECYRVLKRGGILITGFANPIVYMFDLLQPKKLNIRYKIPFDPYYDLSDSEFSTIVTRDGVQFSHTLGEQIGRQIEAGFSITGFYEDKHPSNIQKGYDTYIGAIASRLSEYTAIYYATKSEKR